MIARPYITKKGKEIPWLKNRGYLHITPQLDVLSKRSILVGKVTNPEFVSRYAFFPLIHSVLKERRFKKVKNLTKRCHSYRNSDGRIVQNSKIRPLHYASHFDSLIFGYYAEVLQGLYEKHLERDPELSKCIIAYRKIKSEISSANKSTIHFAGEVFDYIKRNASDSCMVLMFDIKSYFSSIDHEILKLRWANILGDVKLPPDHFNVFKASTQFSYILLDDMRLTGQIRGRRLGFDEKRLSEIRNKNGVFSFFESPREFREFVKSGKVKLHKYPFRNTEGRPIGIPQGLPISATLANLYLLEFDKEIKKKVVDDFSAFYRRYSDDIVVVCRVEDAEHIEQSVLAAIRDSKVEISPEKTDRFMFRHLPDGKGGRKATSIKLEADKSKINYPVSYLGFEFYGDKILVKSANLARFYRRMIFSVKRKARRAKVAMNDNPNIPFVLYRSQLKKLYSNVALKKTKVHRHKKFLIEDGLGYHRIKIRKSENSLRSNYISYIRKASVILDEPSLSRQIRGHIRVFNQAIQKHSKVRDQNWC